HALLFHRIPLAQRNGIAQLWIFFSHRFEINSNSEGRADLILTAIAATDRPALIVKYVHMRTEKVDNLLCFCHQWLLVFQKREDRTLDWRDARVESQDNPSLHFSFLVRRFVLRARFADERQHSSIDTGARLDYARNKFLFRLLVEIFVRLSTGLPVLR